MRDARNPYHFQSRLRTKVTQYGFGASKDRSGWDPFAETGLAQGREMAIALKVFTRFDV